MIAAMFVALSVEIARENGVFTGHPGWMYVCLGIAGLIILWALLFPGKMADAKPSLAHVKDSFNPVNTLTANPTIIVNPGREHEIAKPTPVISLRPSPLEPNLRLGRVWQERLFRKNDEFCFNVRRGMENKFPFFQAIVAEIKNASGSEAVGRARNIKAELVFPIENESVGPLAWLDRLSHTQDIGMGDSAYILLATYLYAPLSKMSEWRVPVNTRPNEAYLPGAEMIDLRQWKHSGGPVKLNIFHPESGRIVKTFAGAYSWPGNQQEPSFIFQLGQENAEEEKVR